VALNPSDKLRTVARDRQWASASFGSRGRPTLGQFIRSVAATVSLVPTFAAGLPIYALTGSRREATNFSISLFAETASALINLDLVVRGEENLWKSRPAVFVFNHQSKADVVIGAKLLRRDMAGIGKQEIKKMPVIGKVLEMGGVVMIDRKNAASAIEAMQPLVDAMRDEGRSVALAPEGTRTCRPIWVRSRKAPSTWPCRPAYPWCRWLSTTPATSRRKGTSCSARPRWRSTCCRRWTPATGPRDHRRARARGAQHVPAHPRPAGRTGSRTGKEAQGGS
jgi:1-acyl-sn-glycerol-3-phosphate acyltransferase